MPSKEFLVSLGGHLGISESMQKYNEVNMNNKS